MVRALTIGGALAVMLSRLAAPVASADPAATVYMFGSCYDPSQPLQEKPQSWDPNVDYTYVDGMPAVHFLNQRPFSCTPFS
jgi:hypothetical protein